MSGYYLQVYGCQMNQHEAGLVRSILAADGFQETHDPSRAELLLVMACAVRSHAEERALGRLKSLRGLARKRPGVLTGLLGCMSADVRDSVVTERKADLVIGPDQYRRLPELVRAARHTKDQQAAGELTGENYDGIYPEARHPVCGTVTVMRGCDCRCSYCVVPLTRGPERSKQLKQVLAETEHLAARGIQDLTLLGQNVLAYDDGRADFTQLLREVSAVAGIRRIRFLTSHPKDLTKRVLEKIAALPKVCPALHLPVQSGSDRILELMNRPYTRQEYSDKVRLARTLLPDLGLTTDVMVGFPSETEQDLEDTLDLVKEVRFDFAYMFRFSQRPGTAAEKLGPKVSESEAGRRLAVLIETQNRITRERNHDMIGRSFELLIEGAASKGGGMLGRTRSNRPVVVYGDVFIGDVLEAKVTGMRGWTPVAEHFAAVAAAAPS
ncbi:MAG: tRNA (N6-isopentenyl adenosine(37)-C2)-methylthiotransferase MiaB [candidate division WOR-3 bacterium]|nr:MAG: tRNA (N6-isopentenyl adenosine(37)-C2)-methylthiotransferase MiaB [candidate division WOR-3 bacterium]